MNVAALAEARCGFQASWNQRLLTANSLLSLTRAADAPGLPSGWRFQLLSRVGQEANTVLAALFALAAEMGCSDVHFELADSLRVYFRKHGDLVPVLTAPSPIGEVMVGRIRSISGLPLYRQTEPQSGRMEFCSAEVNVCGRASIVRLPGGVRVVVRLMLETGKQSLKDLGASAREASIIFEMAGRPGLVLISGPAGSGKTTTLYSLVSWLADSGKHVITMEDPVEQLISGVTQMEFGRLGRMTLVECFGSTLRLDPDAIVVGEIRDGEAARIAVRAALTGRPALASVHAKDAIESIYRISELGVDIRLVAAAINGCVNQRLVSTGEGRRAVFEIQAITPLVRRAIENGSSLTEVRRILVRSGVSSLIEEAF